MLQCNFPRILGYRVKSLGGVTQFKKTVYELDMPQPYSFSQAGRQMGCPAHIFSSYRHDDFRFTRPNGPKTQA